MKRYIAEQENHHRNVTFDEKWLTLHKKLIDCSNVTVMEYEVVDD